MGANFDINQAARLMRAGDQFSKTNRKLVNAVSSFVQWLFESIGEYQLPVEIGWVVDPGRPGEPIRLGFKMAIGGWNDVYSDPNKTNIHNAINFCQTLISAEGQRLIDWIEQTVSDRKRLLVGLENVLAVLQSKS